MNQWDTDKDIKVCYHGEGCVDGHTAAWVLWRKFGDEAEYKSFPYTDPSPSVAPVDGCEVYVVDYTFDRETMKRMEGQADSILVLDHHDTAERRVSDLDFCVFDQTRSGAGLAWDHFFPDEERPWIVDYVEDRDLWNWDLPDSKGVNAVIQGRDRTFDQWNRWFDDPSSFEDVREKGREVAGFLDKHVEEIAEKAEYVDLLDWRPLAVNASVFASEVGNELASEAPFAIVWHRIPSGAIKVSLRADGGKDSPHVGEIAEEFGGGGHANAAGFRLPFDEFVDTVLR